MKINDKNLVSYSRSHENVDKEGYLLKKGENSRNFQRRWFVLKGNLLFYFDKPADQEPIGVIILEGCTTELADSSEHYSFKIIFQSCTTRSYDLAAESQESLEIWMLSIARASYDYLKLLVSELQKNLQDAQEKSNKDGTFIAPVTFMTPSNRNRRINPFDNTNERTFSEMWEYGASQSCQSVVSETRHSRSCGVNNAIPPSIPFRTAPPPPTVRDRKVLRNANKNSFNHLHNMYGKHIMDEKRLVVQSSTNITDVVMCPTVQDCNTVADLIGL